MKHIWIEIFGQGDTEHAAGGFTVNETFFASMRKAFEKLKRKYRYFPPATAEHPEILGELIGEPNVAGVVYGLVTALRQTEAGGIEAGIRLNKLGEKLYNLGALTYVSPSFYHQWRDPHTSDILENVLREVSFVTVPHQKNLKTELAPAYRLAEAISLNEAGFLALEEGSNVEEETIEETTTDAGEGVDNAELDPALMEAMRAMIAEMIAEAMGGDTAAPVEDEPAPEGGEAPSEEVVSMKERLYAMERQLATEKATAATAKEMPGANETMIADLVAVRLADEARYKRIAKAVRTAKAEATKLSEPAPAGFVGASVPVSLSATVISQAVSLAEEAAVAGIPRGTKLCDFMESRGMSQRDVYNALGNKTVQKRIKAAYSARK